MRCGKLKSGAVPLMRPCAGSGRCRCGAGANTESEPAIGINDARSADDCFARFERGAIPRAGFIGQKADQDLARGSSWGHGMAAWHPGGPVRLVRARNRHPPLHPLLHCALLMSPTFPEGARSGSGLHGNGAMQGPVMGPEP